MNLDLYDMYCFKLLVENMNFTKASEILGESQPSLSKRIKRIENDLGYALFQRTTRSMVLTEEGKVFYDFSSRTLRLYGELKEELARKNHILKIGYLYEWQFQLIVSLNSELSKYSDLEIELVNCSEESLGEEADLYFTAIQDFVARYSHRYIGRNGLAAYVSIYHELAKHKELSLRDIADQKLILVHKKTESGRINYNSKQILEALVCGGVPEEEIAYDKDRFDMIYKICTEKRIGILYDRALLLENTEIVKIPLVELRDAFPIHLIYKDAKKVKPYLDYLDRILDEV